jgi:hypothetical protein
LRFSARFSLFSLHLSVKPRYSQVCKEDKVLNQATQHGAVVCMNAWLQSKAYLFIKAIFVINLLPRKEDADWMAHV